MKFRSFVSAAILGMAIVYSVQACTLPAKETTIFPKDRQPVKIEVGLTTFVEFCYKSGPSFSNVEDRALSGNYKLGPSGWLEHSDSDVSLLVRDHNNFKACQLIFTSDQSTRIFEKNMETPFNAKEVAKADFHKLYRSEGLAVTYKNIIKRIFVSKTTFDGDVPAIFYGTILDGPDIPQGQNSFALFVLVDKE